MTDDEKIQMAVMIAMIRAGGDDLIAELRKLNDDLVNRAIDFAKSTKENVVIYGEK